MSTPTAGHGTGPPENVAGALSYLLGPVTGIAFLLLEKENRFVRFHAMQATLTGIVFFIVNVALTIFDAILSRIPFVGWLFSLGVALVVGLATLVLWLALMYRAYQGDEWELPVLGEQARRLLSGVAMQ